MSARDVRVVIDRLVLRGVPAAQAAAVRRGLIAGLESALAGADPAALAESGPIRLDVPAAGDPGALGRGAGRALGANLAGRGPAR